MLENYGKGRHTKQAVLPQEITGEVLHNKNLQVGINIRLDIEGRGE